jgi:hypothetical protein
MYKINVKSKKKNFEINQNAACPRKSTGTNKEKERRMKAL